MGEEVDLRELRQDEADLRDAWRHQYEPLPPIHPSLRGFASAIPDIIAAGIFMLTWIDPLRWRPDMYTMLTVVMLVEMLCFPLSWVLISTLSSRAAAGTKVSLVTVVILVYTLFSGVISLSFRVWWPFISTLLQMLNRSLVGILRGAEGWRDRLAARATVAANALILFFAGVLCLIPTPEFGLTHDMRQQLHLSYTDPLLPPHKLFQLGVTYFLLMAASEIIEHRWIRNPLEEQVRERIRNGLPPGE